MFDKFIGVAACVLFLVSTASSAGTYLYVAAVEGGAVFLNEDTVVRADNDVSFWILQVSNDASQEFSHWLIRQDINCSTRRIRPTDMSIYDFNNERTGADSAGGEDEYIEPGTVDQDLFRAVCQNGLRGNPRLAADTPFVFAKRWRQEIERAKTER